MSGAFEEVRIAWKGRDFIIRPDQVMRCIAKVEDVITLAELEEFALSQRVPFAKIAMAFGTVLRHAGAHVTDFEVYKAMFEEKEVAGSEDKNYAVAIEAVQKLLVLMLPPEYLEKKLAEVTGKPKK